jgi:dTDP-D-glucose 4,6-dehydratase
VILELVLAIALTFFVAVTLAECHFKYLLRKQEEKIVKDCIDNARDKNAIPIDGKFSYAIHNLDSIKRSL